MLSTHLLDARTGGGVYWYAALGVLSAVASDLGLDPEQDIGQRVRREGVAALLTRLMVQDPKALRAYAHPVRMTLIGLLRVRGPLTATQAARLTGESSGTCSFHLRQLAGDDCLRLARQIGHRLSRRSWRISRHSTCRR